MGLFTGLLIFFAGTFVGFGLMACLAAGSYEKGHEDGIESQKATQAGKDAHDCHTD